MIINYLSSQDNLLDISLGKLLFLLKNQVEDFSSNFRLPRMSLERESRTKIAPLLPISNLHLPRKYPNGKSVIRTVSSFSEKD